MAVPQSKQILQRLLQDEQLSPEDLDAFLRSRPREDLYLEFKDGKQIDGRSSAGRDGPTVIRQYVSGFANSEGGVLIIGIEDKTLEITGCPDQGGASLDEWGKSCLSRSMAHFLSPQPRFQTVLHPKGKVLVIAVERAPQLIYCYEAGEMKYYLRIHDDTLAAPSYLISDLVLGRRSHPVFEVTATKLDLKPCLLRPPGSGLGSHGWEISPILRVENASLVPARNVSMALVGWTMDLDVEPPVQPYLRKFMELLEPEQLCRDGPVWRATRRRCDPVEVIPPFDTAIVRSKGRFALPAINAHVSCALYVVAEGHPPAWFELRYSLSGDRVQEGSVTVVETFSENPRVCCNRAPRRDA